MDPLQRHLPKQLKHLAEAAPFPLYVVGGTVRDAIAHDGDFTPSDWDICAPVPYDEFLSLAERTGFHVHSVYKNTGTVKLTDSEKIGYEFSCFRSDKYVRGEHTPCEIFFTDDIELDARRRDFTVNAIYYEIRSARFLDPLGGIPAVRERRLTTVKRADDVFGEDGLRLMRLARQAAQLDFTPDEACLAAAKKNAELICDVHPQRILTELELLLIADGRSGVAYSHYRGIKLLDEIGVLNKILPELTAGRNLEQRKDYHDHDVLEHSLRCLKYSPCESTLRIAALLHDVGKPPCMLKQGNSHEHERVGAEMAKVILNRLTYPPKKIPYVCRLIAEHMYDMNALTRENKLRRYLVKNADLLPDLIALKQADYSACKDDLATAPTCKRWLSLVERMKKEGVPFSTKELNVNGAELIQAGLPAPVISQILQALLYDCAIEPNLNQKEKLLAHAKNVANGLTNR